jgi:hypothetical protein
MADFLTNLAARVRGGADLVRPRLPAMFEPPQGGAGAFIEMEIAAEDTARNGEGSPGDAQFAESPRANPADADLAPRPSRRRPRPPENTSSIDETHTAARETAAIGEPATHVTRRTAMGATGAWVAPQAQRSGEPKERGAAIIDSRPIVPAAHPAELTAHAMSEQASSAAEIAPPRMQPPAAPADRTTAEPDRGHDVTRQHSTGLNVPLSVTAIVEPPRAPPEAIDQTFFSSPPASRPPNPHVRPVWRSTSNVPASEPTVHVTIGRIDVRAVSAAAPVAGKERDRSPVMSLDEYLRTRTPRGGR